MIIVTFNKDADGEYYSSINYGEVPDNCGKFAQCISNAEDALNGIKYE